MDQEAYDNLVRQLLSHLVFIQGGEVTVPVAALDYQHTTLRLALNQKEETITLRLVTNDYAADNPPHYTIL